VAISPDGNKLLVFASNSDNMYFIDLTATAPTAVAIPGFARPVNAFFSSDSSTAYVINCGPECGSTAGPPSVMRFNIASQTITATVPVGGASVGLMKNNNLYVAGYPGGSTGTFDVVNVGSMTRTTANPIAIGDGSHTTMAMSNNNKMYIGAVTCSNTSVGCLSIVDLGSMKLDGVGQPLGAVTGLQSIPNRNTMYTIQGGYLYIYDTTTGDLQSTQIRFIGALNSVVQVDP
jgi:DNA-binding beta-propeller fold protein YncE